MGKGGDAFGKAGLVRPRVTVAKKCMKLCSASCFTKSTYRHHATPIVFSLGRPEEH
jgi:hypothetical protein